MNIEETKTPFESKWYAFSFSTVLETGEGISNPSVNLTVTPSSDLNIDSFVNTTSQVQFLVSGGVDGVDYTVNCKIETDATLPQKFENEMIIPIREII